MMEGIGKMDYADGARYEGEWKDNMMHGNGIYFDQDKIEWNGIFVNGTFDSKIQKKLQGEKVLQDKIISAENSAKTFFAKFKETYAASDKKTMKDNMTPFFGSTDDCIDYVNVTDFPKFEDKGPVWDEKIQEFADAMECKALSQKEEGTIITGDQILVDQLRAKLGGQIVNFNCQASCM